MKRNFHIAKPMVLCVCVCTSNILDTFMHITFIRVQFVRTCVAISNTINVLAEFLSEFYFSFFLLLF